MLDLKILSGLFVLAMLSLSACSSHEIGSTAPAPKCTNAYDIQKNEEKNSINYEIVSEPVEDASKLKYSAFVLDNPAKNVESGRESFNSMSLKQNKLEDHLHCLRESDKSKMLKTEAVTVDAKIKAAEQMVVEYRRVRQKHIAIKSELVNLLLTTYSRGCVVNRAYWTCANSENLSTTELQRLDQEAAKISNLLKSFLPGEPASQTNVLSSIKTPEDRIRMEKSLAVGSESIRGVLKAKAEQELVDRLAKEDQATREGLQIVADRLKAQLGLAVTIDDSLLEINSSNRDQVKRSLQHFQSREFQNYVDQNVETVIPAISKVASGASGITLRYVSGGFKGLVYSYRQDARDFRDGEFVLQYSNTNNVAPDISGILRLLSLADFMQTNLESDSTSMGLKLYQVIYKSVSPGAILTGAQAEETSVYVQNMMNISAALSGSQNMQNVIKNKNLKQIVFDLSKTHASAELTEIRGLSTIVISGAQSSSRQVALELIEAELKNMLPPPPAPPLDPIPVPNPPAPAPGPVEGI